MPTAIYTLLSSLLVAIVTAIVTVRLSLGRFRTERWWERKADAYSRIVGALSDSIRFCDAEAKNFIGEGAASPELGQRYSDAWHKLERATAIGAYIISDDAASTLDRLARREKNPGTDHYSFLMGESKAYSAALTEIRREAKRDLQVER